MADSRVQLEAERWIVSECLPKHFDGLFFEARKLTLKWGGQFEFDAVSSDGKIACLISTSDASTAGGNLATAKIQKLKCDTLYLLYAEGVNRRVLVFAEESMRAQFEKERKSGRFPPEIELVHTSLPAELYARLLAARKVASAETSPRRR